EAAVRGWAETAALRALRPGRELAWSDDGAHPRPHQRRAGRQPPRQPSDRVPELLRHVRHPLRQEERRGAGRDGLRQVWRAVRRQAAWASLLLAILRDALGP